MLALAKDGAAEGLWLRAQHQTQGRGRLNRPWEGEDGNLYASTLVRLMPADPPAPTLALVAAVAVHEALQRFVPHDDLRIKWPNDIMAGPAKLSGMLLEGTGDAVIIGIGVNVTHHPLLADRATTCLRALGATEVDAGALLQDIAQGFARYLALWRMMGVPVIRNHWLERAHLPGTALRANLPDGEVIPGTFETLDNDGALKLRLANGTISVIHAGDIFLV
jgi:BirA family biotin operon repressor/biotin-[acetyl-CoA-carboxylase] ligase